MLQSRLGAAAAAAISGRRAGAIWAFGKEGCAKGVILVLVKVVPLLKESLLSLLVVLPIPPFILPSFS